ncbi:MAG TPA: SBBP repeat-containing protein, partial [Candidatus Syntrophosphaera thermopropionivorans]|nr:SBBP repeat-containing protein [Candidatus Syntrophosphaera thermopropionivorans]
MKKTFLIVLLLLSCVFIFAQLNPWLWVKNNIGINTNCISYGIAVDASGNSYVTGYFQGTATFGYTTLTSSGGSDIFVAKLDSWGNWFWAKNAGGTGADIGYGIAVDASGDSYVTGYFYGSAIFGYTTLTSSGGSDIFVAKLDSWGNWLWAKNAGGTGADIGYGIAVDADGNSYVTGYFQSSPAAFGSTTLISNGDYDIFVAKLDSWGNNWLWAKNAGGTSDDYGEGIAVDADGNSYVTGYFQSSPATFGSTTLISNGDYDIFVAKLDSSGNNWLWAKNAGGTSDDYCYGIAVDASGNSYVTGIFSNSATFGSTTLISNGDYDIFIAKLDSSGDWEWAKKAGGTGGDWGYGIAVDTDGNSYVTGIFYSATAAFGDITLESSGGVDIFVAKLDSSGDWEWANKAGGTDDDWVNGIAVDASGNSYVTGFFDISATFGYTTLINSGGYDIFVAKLDSSGNNWLMATKAGENINYYGNGIAVDADGNSYVTGYFEGSSTFCSTVLTSSGYYDIFVAKLDSSGNWEWAKKAGGTNYDFSYSIAVDTSGSCYITGEFFDYATFGDIILTSNGSYDIFIAKLDSNGNWLWAKKAGGSSPDFGNGIAVDASGNSYVTGYFGGTTATFGSTTLTTNGGYDIFVAKLDSNGNWVWAKNAGGGSPDFGYGIAVDASGNSYVTGYFQSPNAYFDSTTLTNSGSDDIFVAKLDSNGNWVWANKAGANKGDYGYSIAVDASGNSYVTGYFDTSATFGLTTLTSNGSSDIFIAKLDSSGNWLWAKNAGGIVSDIGYGIAVDASGNSYVTGYFDYSASFGSTLTSKGAYDIFVAKLDSSGNWLWAKNAGGEKYDRGRGIAIDANGNSYVTGYFDTSASFGSTTLTSYGSFDIFVAKLDSSGNWLWAKNAGGTNNDMGYDIAVDASGNSYVTGYFSGTSTAGITFGNITIYGLSSGLYTNIFITKVHIPYYPAGVSIVEETYGIPVTVSGGDAYMGTLDNFPSIPNQSTTYKKFNFILDNSISHWTITMQTSDTYGAYYQNNSWHVVNGNGTQIVFNIYLSGTKGNVEVPIILGDQDPALPVELSSFTAYVNPQNKINIMWTTQTETGLLGYN